MTGIELIAAERRRQVEQEGWTQEHDDKHRHGELAMAACYYAVHETVIDCGPFSVTTPELFFPESWDTRWAKRTAWQEETNDSRIRDLAKAGALIAAEIDRLQRAGDQS